MKFKNKNKNNILRDVAQNILFYLNGPETPNENCFVSSTLALSRSLTPLVQSSPTLQIGAIFPLPGERF